jgi:NDP-sugar pyrophosphorylase family protein
MQPVKAVLLAAGRGKRMGPLTESLPKPMVEVQGRPVLEHIVTGLRDRAGIRDFFIITGHKAEIIESHFGDGTRFGIRCAYGRQEVPDGTGKAPELARAWTGADRFVLSYGDVLVDPEEYAGIVAASAGADGVITVKGGEDVRLGGAVVFDELFHLQDLIEKAEPGTVSTPWYNAGIYVFGPALYAHTARLEKSVRGEYELTDALRTMAREGVRIRGYEIQRRWADVRDPEILNRLNREA